MKDKKHWYDGKFYDKIIAPNQDKIFEQIKKIIPNESTVLDIGCGTGRLAIQLSNHCKRVVGVDLSSKNIATANSNHNGNYKNVEFFHGSLSNVKEKFSYKYDYVILTFVIHEMPEVERIKLLLEIKNISNNIIIGEYIAPTPRSILGKFNILIEFIAGKDHFNNYKSFIKNGGIDYLVNKAELKKIFEIKNQPETTHLVVLE